MDFYKINQRNHVLAPVGVCATMWEFEFLSGGDGPSGFGFQFGAAIPNTGCANFGITVCFLNGGGCTGFFGLLMMNEAALACTVCFLNGGGRTGFFGLLMMNEAALACTLCGLFRMIYLLMPPLNPRVTSFNPIF